MKKFFKIFTVFERKEFPSATDDVKSSSDCQKSFFTKLYQLELSTIFFIVIGTVILLTVIVRFESTF